MRSTDSARLEAVASLAAAMAQAASAAVQAQVQTVPVVFSFNTPSPMVLRAVNPGDAVFRALVYVETPFNDSAATVELGTSAAPGGILASTESLLSTPQEQFSTQVVEVFSASDLLLLTISPHSSTQGMGILLLSYYAKGS